MMTQISATSATPLAARAATAAISKSTARVLKANFGTAAATPGGGGTLLRPTDGQSALMAAQAAKEPSSGGLKNTASQNNPELRKAFDAFVGQTFYGQMLQSMGKTVGKPAYMYGGRTEEVFREKLNEVMADKLSQASAETFTGPMFELFSLQRR
jgi:hypothetical protein